MSKILGITVILSIIFISCKKKNRFCTESDAQNFNGDAPCQYIGSVVFWWNKQTQKRLDSLKINPIFFYLNDKSYDVGEPLFESAPECGMKGAITMVKDLRGEKTRIHSYSIKNEDDSVFWSGNVEFKAKNCIKVQLKY